VLRLWPVFAGLQAVFILQDYQACQGVKVLTDSKPLLQRLAQDAARQTDTICSSIWMVLATIGSSNLVNVQWIPGHVDLESNTEANLEAKRLHYHSPRHLWIPFLPARPSNSINRVSLTRDIAATYMPESIGCSPAVSTSSSAGNVIDPTTQWLFSTAGRISALYQAPGLCHLSTLQRR